ncbi:hypothetical protein GCM10011581_04020 [Saccharopolyspora subtropica]|uniref:DUF885 domain-containing protein n=1 Tax=Saccharopolyspora thermophila TaxID=89367 RepID=A0A917N6Z3_9PSEU|nr:DUF885 domain-containing protein [Saccharopolyspora subtropica]GGI70192.1 hypothetical protein GCM10011581_04020 [Saccharopolyspora subtropica]
MDSAALVAEYVRLGLRFDRLLPGFVDSYTGDPAVRRRVADEPVPEPARLLDDVRRLLAALPGSDLADERRRFLVAQLTALECSARKLSGAQVPFPAEVEAYFQVVPQLGDTDEYRQAHRELAALLPGRGRLAERLAAVRRRDVIPAERLDASVRALSSALRDRVHRRFGLPVQEVVEYRIVTDKPWSGFNHYIGGFRSRVAVNADVGHRASNLPHLVAHESYPGHHTEHCRKEAGLARRHALAEHTIFLVNTPQCLMAEGLADLGLHAAVGPGWGPWAAEIFADLGIALDGELAERIERVMVGLLPVRQDALLMLHGGADEAEVVAHLQRWLLMPEARARHLVEFMRDPLWRAYTTTYVEGYRLLRRWLEARPATASSADRYRRLLDEPLVPEVLRAELAARI